MTSNNRIELKVEYHPSGRYTLTERSGGNVKEDCKGPLFSNDDKGEFYKAVANKIADLASQGVDIDYKDSNS